MHLATKDLLRLATIGSVDDGKSTLIGRLLVDTRQLFDDQFDAVVAASEKRGVGDLDLSFVTDGLRAERERMELPSIYFAHERDVVLRDSMWLAVGPWVEPRPGESVERRMVRFRTVGDANLTGAVDSTASTLSAVIAEVASANVSERGATRADDRFSETAMEDRKREGYF